MVNMVESEELRSKLYRGIDEFKSKDLEIKNKHGQIITILHVI